MVMVVLVTTILPPIHCTSVTTSIVFPDPLEPALPPEPDPLPATDPDSPDPLTTLPLATDPDTPDPDSTLPLATDPDTPEPLATDPESTTEPLVMTLPLAIDPDSTDPLTADPDTPEPDPDSEPLMISPLSGADPDSAVQGTSSVSPNTVPGVLGYVQGPHASVQVVVNNAHCTPVHQ